MLVPARRQFSVQTGVVWEGVRGILLDTETAECHRRTDILGEKQKRQKKEKKTERKEKKKNKKKETSDKCSFLPEKATHFFWSVKNHKLSRRERSRVMGILRQILKITFSFFSD